MGLTTPRGGLTTCFRTGRARMAGRRSGAPSSMRSWSACCHTRWFASSAWFVARIWVWRG